MWITAMRRRSTRRKASRWTARTCWPSAHLDRHAAYVGLTRHREGVELHWAREDLRDRAGLERVLSRERAKDTTLDYAGRLCRAARDRHVQRSRAGRGERAARQCSGPQHGGSSGGPSCRAAVPGPGRSETGSEQRRGPVASAPWCRAHGEHQAGGRTLTRAGPRARALRCGSAEADEGRVLTLA